MVPSGTRKLLLKKGLMIRKMADILQKINNHLPSLVFKWGLKGNFLRTLSASCKTQLRHMPNILMNSIIKARYMYGDFEGNCLEFHTETGDKCMERNSH